MKPNQNSRWSSRFDCLNLICRQARSLVATAVLGLSFTAAYGATVISLDATDKALGPLDPWPNTGTIAGDFNAAATITGNFFTPGEVVTIDGVNAVVIPTSANGTTGTAYEGPYAPDFMCGGASRTIEAWVWDPQLQDEKTVISWGHRGGAPDGSNCTFGHGVHATWGFLGGWGYADIGDTNNPSIVIPRRWTYIAYTYDSATRTARIYQDGVQINVEAYPTQPLVTWTNLIDNLTPIPFRVARQTEGSGLVSNSGLGTNILGRIRVHDTALTSLQISNQFQAEKATFKLNDTDTDGIPDWWEIRHGFNPNLAADAASDPDADASTNLQEYQRGTLPLVADTDGDGVNDGAETKTGIYVSPADRGTDPLRVDSDSDGLSDGVETGTGVFVNATNTGSNPNKKDTDNDTWDDAGEVLLGSNPNSASSIPTATSWAAAVTVSNPKYWFRFEQTDPSQAATNSGSAQDWQGAYGPGIVAANLGIPSALPSLGTCVEFTGPAAPNSTTKYVDMAATYPGGTPSGNPEIPELVNYRPPAVDKTTTVEYWFKTTQVGTHGNNSWQSPSIMAHESPGDGDMYWGKINNVGEFGFSTSDNNDILTQRDMGKDVTDNNWHHLVMIKEWHVNQANISRMYLDGGPLQPGGASFTRTLGSGNSQYQDLDSFIRYLGFTQSGELENVQYIGYLDEVVIYDRALTEAEVRLHSQAVLGADTDGDTMPDVYELSNGLNPNDGADAHTDPDNDGSTNLQEYLRKTDPQDSDSDDDGVLDGSETNTGIWVSPTDRGTDPLDADTDNDNLLDGVENNTGTYVSPAQTGTSPLERDTDSDGFTDGDEVLLGFNPNQSASKPAIPATYAVAVEADQPVHWLRFEETTTASGAVNQGSSAPSFFVSYGSGILDTDLGKPSAYTNLGNALEFTGPQAANSTTKYLDFGQPINELVNYREPDLSVMEDGKATTVEYWFKTTLTGSHGNNTWENPSLLAHESGGDGDMYWGNFNQDGDFIFSTSDLHDAHVTGRYATDGTWHHVVMTKIWFTNAPCITRLFMDGGAGFGGRTIETSTGAGATSGQDLDGFIQYLGFTQNGGLENSQFIGMIDEFAVYTNAFVEAQARIHYIAGGGQPHSPAALQHQTLGSQLVLTWQTGTLVSADEVNGTYSPVVGASSPYTNNFTGNRKFFRLQLP
ncbi:MAG TPA: LamG-like jellyroll fold domain-containing protein [Verrucomicrobiae bacterium]|nr:LamG-like jellyroll fold domain-containing protein [Verrucomicrobiae bacterium]